MEISLAKRFDSIDASIKRIEDDNKIRANEFNGILSDILTQRRFDVQEGSLDHEETKDATTSIYDALDTICNNGRLAADKRPIFRERRLPPPMRNVEMLLARAGRAQARHTMPANSGSGLGLRLGRKSLKSRLTRLHMVRQLTTICKIN